MLRRSFQLVLTVVVAGAMLVGAGTGASATGQVAGTQTVTVTAVPDPASAEIREMAEALKAGQEITIQEPGGAGMTLRLDRGNLTATPGLASGSGQPGADQGVAACWRAYTVASVIFAAGAVVIGTIVAAAIASGAAFITIVGYTFSTGAWAAIAGAMGSWSALLAIVSAYTC